MLVANTHEIAWRVEKAFALAWTNNVMPLFNRVCAASAVYDSLTYDVAVSEECFLEPRPCDGLVKLPGRVVLVPLHAAFVAFA